MMLKSNTYRRMHRFCARLRVTVPYEDRPIDGHIIHATLSPAKLKLEERNPPGHYTARYYDVQLRL